MFIECNINPLNKNARDCTIRAISLAMGQHWVKTYIDLCIQGLIMCDMPSIDSVWGEYLNNNGFIYEPIPNFCPKCYTVKEFCKENNKGEYILATGTHVIFVKNGDYYDTWDSGDNVPIYLWRKK